MNKVIQIAHVMAAYIHAMYHIITNDMNAPNHGIHHLVNDQLGRQLVAPDEKSTNADTFTKKYL